MTSPNRTEAQVTYRVLVLGASYGSLFATKLLMAGHSVSLVCATEPYFTILTTHGSVTVSNIF